MRYEPKPHGLSERMNNVLVRRPAQTLIAVALLSLVAGALLPGFFNPATGVPGAVDPALPSTPALTITSTLATEKEWPHWIEASGEIAPWQEAVIGATTGGSRLLELGAEVGDRVRKDQLLARFDDETLRAEVAELKAGVAQARATLREAESNRERALAMGRISALSEQEIQQHVTRAETARAQLESAQARLASRELQLSHTVVTAPDDGVISARTATLGSVSQGGQELFRLIRQSRLEWRGELTAQQVVRVVPGQAVTLHLPDKTTVVARIRKIAPSMDDQSRLAMVFADLSAESAAKAGMYVSGTIALEAAPALVVPAQSVVIRDGRSFVFRVDGGAGDARVIQQRVEVGRRYGGEAEIISGLAAGDRVAVQGAGFLTDRDFVRLARSGDEVGKQ